MNAFPLAFPVISLAVLGATALSLPAAADDCGPTAAIAAAIAAATVADAPVADDPAQPLDPRDPQFAEKAAQRYRQMLRSAPARRTEAEQ